MEEEKQNHLEEDNFKQQSRRLRHRITQAEQTIEVCTKQLAYLQKHQRKNEKAAAGG
jgi:hypothetical protein